jgi:hypothetical protein
LNIKRKMEVNKRRQRAYELHLQGLKQDRIAEQLQTSQSSVSRDLHLLAKEGQRYVYDLARGTIASEFKQCLDGIALVKSKTWDFVSMCNEDPNQENKRLMLAAMRLIVQCEESRYNILVDSPSVLAVSMLDKEVSEIEQQYKESNR